MKKWFSRYSQQIFLFAVMVLICIVLTAQSKYFLTWKNIRNILEANSYRLILAIGMTFVIASGVMDLSAGAIVSMCGVIMAGAARRALCSSSGYTGNLLWGGNGGSKWNSDSLYRD